MKYKNLSLLKNFGTDAINRVSEHETKKQYSLKEFLRHIDSNNKKLKKIEALLHGTFRSNQAGTGFDFNEIREYKMGDDLRHISWSSTAKTGSLQTKEYFAEKEIRSYFLIDISNSMFCGNKLEPFIKTLAFLLNLSSSFSEKVGGVFYSEDIKYHFPAQESNFQANVIFQTCLNFYNSLNKKITDAPTITNISKAIEFAKRYFNRKGIIFILSDFLNLSNWEKPIYETAQNQNIYSFQIYDPLDFILPKAGYITIIDPETKELCTVNTDSKTIQETYKKATIEKQEKLNNFLKTVGANHMLIEMDDFK